ncbi:MFS general substrate transporter [Peniophora sp. CONT]|nr:MFS general substrate transporter [Peniophora sp. CONT]
MTVATQNGRVADEETPLLETQHKKATPIPWKQVSLVMLIQAGEPLTSQVIYPFAPEFVRRVGITGGDESKVGLYVGLMQSIFFATQALTVLHWSRLSDIIGRRPVILQGLFGLSISMYCFGLSRTYWGAVFSRSLNGALNGNIGVMKGCIAEITDSTNLATVYGLLPIAWASGGTLGPAIGGWLSRPAERYPDVFGHSDFLKKYPYFLPCAVPATFTAFAWLITFVYFKETMKNPTPIRDLFGRKDKTQDEAERPDIPDSEKPVPFRSLLVYRVLIGAINYTSLSLVDIAYRAVQPLFFSTPIELGGLGLPPPIIGNIMSAFGVINGVFQIMMFARIHNRFGTKNVFFAGMLSAVPLFALFPIMNELAVREGGVNTAVWFVVAVQTLLSLGISLCYGCIFIFITASAPNRASLGSVNGIAQLMVSIIRTIGPALANSLFSLSVKHKYLGGYMVYYVLVAMSLASLILAAMLPRQVWRHESK